MIIMIIIIAISMVHVLIKGDYIWIKKDTVSFHLTSMKSMMMICFCGIFDRQKPFSFTSSQDHCQRSSTSRISNTPQARFELVQTLTSDLDEWCAIVITITPRCNFIYEKLKRLRNKILQKTILSFLSINSTCWSRDMLNFGFLEKSFSPTCIWNKKDIFHVTF